MTYIKSIVVTTRVNVTDGPCPHDKDKLIQNGIYQEND